MKEADSLRTKKPPGKVAAAPLHSNYADQNNSLHASATVHVPFINQCLLLNHKRKLQGNEQTTIEVFFHKCFLYDLIPLKLRTENITKCSSVFLVVVVPTLIFTCIVERQSWTRHKSKCQISLGTKREVAIDRVALVSGTLGMLRERGVAQRHPRSPKVEKLIQMSQDMTDSGG